MMLDLRHYTFFDRPFITIYNLLDGITGSWTYFAENTLLKVMVLIALVVIGTKMVIGTADWSHLTKLGINFIVAIVILQLYTPALNFMTGTISNVTEGIMMGDVLQKTYDQKVAEGDAEKWLSRYSDIVKTVEEEDPQTGVFKTFVRLNIVDPNTGFLMIGDSMHAIILVVGVLMDMAALLPTFKNLILILFVFVTVVCILVCAIAAILQYVVAIVEFLLIKTIGIVFIPFMVADQTRTLSEKLIAALIALLLKMFILTIIIYLIVAGFLTLLSHQSELTFGNLTLLIFTSVFYAMIAFSGPKLAATLSTGQPQMGAGDLLKAGGALMASTLTAGRAAGFAVKGSAKTAVGTAGTVARYKGAAKSGGFRGTMRQLGKDGATTAKKLGKRAWTGTSSWHPSDARGIMPQGVGMIMRGAPKGFGSMMRGRPQGLGGTMMGAMTGGMPSGGGGAFSLGSGGSSPPSPSEQREGEARFGPAMDDMIYGKFKKGERNEDGSFHFDKDPSKTHRSSMMDYIKGQYNTGHETGSKVKQRGMPGGAPPPTGLLALSPPPNRLALPPPPDGGTKMLPEPEQIFIKKRSNNPIRERLDKSIEAERRWRSRMEGEKDE